MKNKRSICYHKHEKRVIHMACWISFIIAMIVLLAALSSCGTAHKGLIRQIDSVYIEKHDTIIYRDTTILYQPVDSTVHQAIDTSQTSHLETDLAISRAWLRGGRLHHTLSNKTNLIPIKTTLPQSISTQKHYLVRNITQTVEVERSLRWYQEALMWVGKMSLFLLCLAIIRSYIKIKSRL